MTQPTATQTIILRNVLEGRRAFDGMPEGRSAAGGWDRSFASCRRHGWLSLSSPVAITDAGKMALLIATARRMRAA